jgi:hypothetical protein
MAFSWANLPGKPFVTVSPVGGALPNNGADFGPNTAGTTTNGIQEAIASLPGSGGVVYCLAGSYNLTTSLYNTGSFQVVMFAAGAILNFSATGTYETTDLNGPSDILVGTRRTPTEVNYHDCYWYGSGTQINASGIQNEQILAAQHAGTNTPSTSPPGYNLVVNGFTISNIGNISFFIGANNYTSGVTYPHQIRTIRFSRIAGTWAPGRGPYHCGGGSGFAVQGSARQVVVEDALLDTSALSFPPDSHCVIPYIHDVSNCFIRSNAGDATQIVIRRGFFINGGRGSSFELQGNDSGVNGTQPRDAHRLSIEGCVFDSGSSSVSQGGSGGGYIDDYDTNAGNKGYIKEVVFRRTKLVNVKANYKPRATGIFGELSFRDGTLMPGAFSTSISPTLFNYRVPGDPGQALTPTPTPYTYQNLNGLRVTVLVSGGAVTSLAINGTPVGVIGGAFLLDHGDSVTIGYTSVPAVALLSVT